MQLTIKKKPYDGDPAKDRDKFIGGSDAGVIFGLNPYKSAYRLWAEKTGKISGHVPDNDAMRTGRDLEQYVADRFCEQTGKKVHRVNATYYIEEYPFIAGHVDRKVVGENAILECKTASSFRNEEYAAGNFPAHYYAQCQHYMAVTGADRVYLACLCFPHLYFTCYERDEAEIEALVSAEREFWRMIQENEEPAPDGSESSAETLRELYPDSDPGKSLTMTKDITKALEVLESMKQTADQIKAEIETQQNIIKAFMGEAETAVSADWTVTWKTQKRTAIDTVRLKAERPDIYEHYQKTTETRTFRTKRSKKK